LRCGFAGFRFVLFWFRFRFGQTEWISTCLCPATVFGRISGGFIDRVDRSCGRHFAIRREGARLDCFNAARRQIGCVVFLHGGLMRALGIGGVSGGDLIAVAGNLAASDTVACLGQDVISATKVLGR